MKIILNAQEVCFEQPRGISNYTINLYKSLVKRDRNDYVMVYFDKDGERNNRKYINQHLNKLNVPIVECRELHYGHSLLNDVYRNKSFLNYINLDADIVYFSYNCGIPNNTGAKTVTTVHDLFPIVFKEFYSYQLQSEFIFSLLRLLNVNAIVIADSDYTKNELCYYTSISPERVFVVPAGYNKQEFYPQHDTSVLSKYNIIEPYFLYFGTIDERKNLRRLIDAYKMVSCKFPECQLVLAGGYETSFRDLTDYVQTAQKTNKIISTGYVTGDERRALMSGAIGFVFPSLAEGFGLPVLEAMACGAPVITSNTSSLPEVAGDAAILINPADVEQLAYEMERVLTSQSLRNDMIAEGFENCKRFSWDKTAEMTEEVYRIAYESSK